MADAFFNYFKKERETVSQDLLGPETERVKEYTHVPVVELPQPNEMHISLDTALTERVSTRVFSDTPISIADLSAVLYWGIGKANRPDLNSRSYPSGGGKYPLEGYVILFPGGEVPAGVYHYNVGRHVLSCLCEGDFFKIAASIPGYVAPKQTAALLIFTFIKSRSIQTYGGGSYKLGLLDAGHVGQNMYLLSSALDLGCSSLGACDTPEIEGLLGIDGENENIVYGCVLGNKENKL